MCLGGSESRCSYFRGARGMCRTPRHAAAPMISHQYLNCALPPFTNSVHTSMDLQIEVSRHTSVQFWLFLGEAPHGPSCEGPVVEVYWGAHCLPSRTILLPPTRHRNASVTPARLVPGPLIPWPENTSCSRIPHRASRASLRLPPRWWAMTCCWCPLCPCTAPLICSLQSLLIFSFTISAPVCSNCMPGPSWFHFALTESRKPNLWNCVCNFTSSSSAFAFLIEMDFNFEFLFAIWLLSL